MSASPITEQDIARAREEAHGVSYTDIDAFLHGRTVRQEAAEIICRTFEKTRHKREQPKAP